MKGLILSGGHGTRLRPLTHSQQKQLIPIANKPILFYCIEDLISSGIKDIGIVIGPNKEQVMEAVNKAGFDANIQFIHQDHPRGLAHAVKISKDFLGNDKFVMYLGDNLLKGGIKNFVDSFRNSNASAKLLLTRVDDPQRYGVAVIDEQKKVITKLVEKPSTPISNLTLVGIYGLTPHIFEAIENINPSWRNELEITDALQWLIDKGHEMHYEMVEGWWKDTGRMEDMLEANRLILDDIDKKIIGEVIDSQIIGRVVVEEGARISNSIIKGPSIVGKNTILENACIGAYTSIGDGCKVSHTEVEDSMIMDGTEIRSGEKITNSLIGRNVKLLRNDSLPKGKRFVIGDNSLIHL